MIDIKLEIDYQNMKVEELYDRAVRVAKTRQKAFAEGVRDMLKEEFYEVTHKTVYGRVTPLAQGSPASLAEHGLVMTSDSENRDIVGAKKGAVYESTYSKIFNVIQEGRRYDELKVFKLPKHREDASPDGYWRIRYLEPRPFLDNTLRRLEGPDGDRLFESVYKKDIEKALRGG